MPIPVWLRIGLTHLLRPRRNRHLDRAFVPAIGFRAGHVARKLLAGHFRSEEHTSELQSRLHLVCRLLLEKKQVNAGHVAFGERLPARVERVSPRPSPAPGLPAAAQLAAAGRRPAPAPAAAAELARRAEPG